MQKCEKCYKQGSNLKLRYIQLYSGHVYKACLDCRKDLTVKTNPATSITRRKAYKMFRFRPDLEVVYETDTAKDGNRST